MGTAYTPGLTVSADQIVRKVRRLPLKGQVLVNEGDLVEPHTVVARTELPGLLQAIKVAEKLNVEPKEVMDLLKFKVGDKVKVGDLVAETKGLFGKLFKNSVISEYEGTIESISDVSGHIYLREAPIPIEINAYIKGKVVDIIPEEGAVVEARGAFVQGIFGIGGERVGEIHVAVSSPDEVLDAKHITEEHKNKILIGGSGITLDAIRKAEQVGATGIVAGAVKDIDITNFLGYDIGVAITGQEAIPITIIATEGFGSLPIAKRTFELFQSLEGKSASINGATQIRAGVIRPEVIIPSDKTADMDTQIGEITTLDIGTPIRIIREPYFGKLGEVIELPPELQVVESGTHVRVLKAKLTDGEIVTVPRANVEITSY